MTKDRTLSTAIHILTVLAREYPELLTSDYLSNSLQTNPGFVRRALSKLQKNGLVTSVKGKSGGYFLAVPAETINLRQIYIAMEAGPLFRTFDKEPFPYCPVSRQIGGVLCNVYDDLENALLLNMEEMPLSKIVDQIE